jgi:hypothetical protein
MKMGLRSKYQPVTPNEVISILVFRREREVLTEVMQVPSISNVEEGCNSEGRSSFFNMRVSIY